MKKYSLYVCKTLSCFYLMSIHTGQGGRYSVKARILWKSSCHNRGSRGCQGNVCNGKVILNVKQKIEVQNCCMLCCFLNNISCVQRYLFPCAIYEVLLTMNLVLNYIYYFTRFLNWLNSLIAEMEPEIIG